MKSYPGQFLGYRKNGAPIFLIAGGDRTNDPQVVDPPADPPPPAGKTFTEEQLNKRLEDERKKLYARLETTSEAQKAMETEVKALREAREADEKEKAKRIKEAETAAKKAAEAEMSAKDLIESRQREWEAAQVAQQEQWMQQIGGLQQQLEQRDAILAKERERSALATYAQAQINAAQDEIAPELIDYITGNSEQEIDVAIARAREKTQLILKNIQDAQIQQRAAMPGVSTSGYSTTGPLEGQGSQKTFTAEEINAMSAAEYQKNRHLFPTGQVSGGKGIYG